MCGIGGSRSPSLLAHELHYLVVKPQVNYDKVFSFLCSAAVHFAGRGE
jgi:hypothetical protein